MKTSAQVLTDKDQTINELDFQKTVLENELKILAAKIREIQKALDLKETFALNLKLQLDKSQQIIKESETKFYRTLRMTADKATEIGIDFCGQSAETTVQRVAKFEEIKESKDLRLIANSVAARASCAQPLKVENKPVGTSQGVVNDNLLV